MQNLTNKEICDIISALDYDDKLNTVSLMLVWFQNRNIARIVVGYSQDDSDELINADAQMHDICANCLVIQVGTKKETIALGLTSDKVEFILKYVSNYFTHSIEGIEYSKRVERKIKLAKLRKARLIGT